MLWLLIPINTYIVKLKFLPKGLVYIFRLTTVDILGVSLWINGIKFKLLQSYTEWISILMQFVRLWELIFVSNVDISDCNLQIIDYLYNQLRKISLLSILLFLVFLSKIIYDCFAIALNLFFTFFDNLCIFAIPLRNRYFWYNKFEPLKKNFYFAGSETLPRDIHLQTP